MFLKNKAAGYPAAFYFIIEKYFYFVIINQNLVLCLGSSVVERSPEEAGVGCSIHPPGTLENAAKRRFSFKYFDFFDKKLYYIVSSILRF